MPAGLHVVDEVLEMYRYHQGLGLAFGLDSFASRVELGASIHMPPRPQLTRGYSSHEGVVCRSYRHFPMVTSDAYMISLASI